MKPSFITLALMAGIAACNAPAESTVESDSAQTQAPKGANLFADLGGENSGPIHTQRRGDTLAVSGYDVVSYSTGDAAPVKGTREFTVRYQGFDYRFASEGNAQAFIEDPAKYAPAYGGYCAWAIGANNALAPGDPQVYEIVDGTLYLNYDEDVQARWEKDIPGFIESGDENYLTHAPDEHFKG